MNKFSKDSREMQIYRKMDFISNRFKRKFVLRFCAIIVLGALLSGAVIYWMSKATVTTTFESGRLKIISTADFILPAVMLSSAVVIAFIGISALIILLLAYNRLKLSLCQLEVEIEKADEGDLDKSLFFEFKDEEFKVLAVSLDKLIYGFGNVIRAVKNNIAELETDLKEFEEKKNQEIPKKMKEELRKLKEDIMRFNA